MTMRFRKKVLKNRGRRTQGYGRQQGRRKTGRKHGHGITSDWQKGLKSRMIKLSRLGNKTNIWGKNRPNPWIFGKHGFKRPQTIQRIYHKNIINIGSLDAKLDKWVEQGLATKSGAEYTVDLEKLDYQKLLAKGQIKKKVNVTVREASAYAIEEVENAGGKVILTAPKKEEQ